MTQLRLATEADDAVLRAMLRDNGMRTWVEMAVEREPSFFAGKHWLGEEWAVLAEEGGAAIGMYTAAIRAVYVNGKPERVGYLGGLRVNQAYRHRLRHLRRGYASIRALAPAAGTMPWWYTVVATENSTARRLLEAGVQGLPKYFRLGNYETLGVPTVRRKHRGLWRMAGQTDISAIIAFHNSQASNFDLTPVLDQSVVQRVGVNRFHLLERAGRIEAVAALWDQRAFKQIVARSYRPPVASVVPAYNLYAKLCKRIPLPRVGDALEQTFVAFLALSEEALRAGEAAIQDLLSYCTTPVATFGAHEGSPLLEILDSFKPMRYPASVYGVVFEGSPPDVMRPVQPEVALL